MEWRDVVGQEGKYLVSDTGMVKSMPRKGTQGGRREFRARTGK